MTQKYLSRANIMMVDPGSKRLSHDNWKAQLIQNGVINYGFYPDISAIASECIVKYILDLEEGKNLAKGVRKGMRSYNYLTGGRVRIKRIITQLETYFKKDFINLTEDEVLLFFTNMRNGIIRNYRNEMYVGSYNQSRIFCVFWRWLMRVKHKEGITLPDIVYSIDNAPHKKPKWNHFTIKEVDLMAQYAPSIYYRTLLYFLFDSGIRAPQELMNVRACDITPVANSNQLHLQIRDDTSKTFGRKIKLMISSEAVKKYIEITGKKGEDFLFDRTYIVMHRVIGYLGYKILKIGELRKQKAKYKYLVKGGVRMYDFRHNSVCHYLPIYKSENQLKYRYGWKKAAMIEYYSEYMGMKDTVTDEDMLIDQAKTGIILELERERQRVGMLQEQVVAQKNEFEERMKRMETMMTQRFSAEYGGGERKQLESVKETAMVVLQRTTTYNDENNNKLVQGVRKMKTFENRGDGILEEVNRNF